MQVNLSIPSLIVHPNDLQQLVEILSGEPIIGIDTESNSLHAYREQVCLVQFSTPHEDFLVDPLELQDLSPLAPVFANPDIEMVFHAAEYDVMCLKRDFGFEFMNLFDTMIAARILGIKEVGLGALLLNEFGVTLDKRYQRANWGKRPLSAEQLAYACMDTHYLIPLRERLLDELEARQLLALAVEDFRRVSNVNGNYNHAETDICWQIGGAYDLTPRQVAILIELCEYRDRVAYSLDRPLFKVLSNKTLLAIAEQCPTQFEQLRRIPGLSPHNLRQHGRELVSAVRRGLHAEPVRLERPPRPDSRFLARLDALREWRKNLAQQWKVESDVILPKDILVEISKTNPHTMDDLAVVMETSPWRLQKFGEQIMSVITKKH
ncbi:MAG: ribonuclease D [Chloroflexota bacterium]